MISCQNGLLDLDDRTLHDTRPALFNLVRVPFDYDPNAPEPTAWLKFLTSCGPTTKTQSLLLQEYFGYVLSGRLDMHKLLMLVGPIRSGKGTIARMLTSADRRTRQRARPDAGGSGHQLRAVAR